MRPTALASGGKSSGFKEVEMSSSEHRRRILLVDDDCDFVEATATILREKNYDVVIAASGEEGLRKVREEPPVLIILDLMLPDRDGFSICSELKDDVKTSGIPVLVLTGVTKSGGRIREIAGHHHADDCMEKPFKKQELLDTVEKLIARAASAMEKVRTTILIADDDPDFVLSTRRILETNGYRVLLARDGSECVAVAREHTPDMIILDVMLPDKDGYTVCSELKEGRRTHAIPVLMATVIGKELKRSDFACEIAVWHDADDYLDKPFSPEDLLKKVRRHTRTARFY